MMGDTGKKLLNRESYHRFTSTFEPQSVLQLLKLGKRSSNTIEWRFIDMTVKEKNSGQVFLLEPTEKSEVELFHELICALRLNSNLRIGAFERRYSTYCEASKVMDALMEKGVFHAGTIRTHYMDGTVRLLGAWLYGASKNNGIGKQVAADMLGHIVGDNAVGIFETEKLFRSEVVKEILAGIIPE